MAQAFKILGELSRTLVAVSWALGEGSLHNMVKLGVQGRIQLADWKRLLVRNAEHHTCCILAREWFLSRQHAVQNDSQREQVGAAIQ